MASELRWPVVLFDLDGTVIDSFEGISESVRAAFELIEEPLPPEERYAAGLGRRLPRPFPKSSRTGAPRRSKRPSRNSAASTSAGPR